ncbi:448_t:CDS:2, partial [Funneliformis geosporum]
MKLNLFLAIFLLLVVISQAALARTIEKKSSGQSPRGPGHHTRTIEKRSSGQSPRGPGHHTRTIEKRSSGPSPRGPGHHTRTIEKRRSGQNPRAKYTIDLFFIGEEIVEKSSHLSFKESRWIFGLSIQPYHGT